MTSKKITDKFTVVFWGESNDNVLKKCPQLKTIEDLTVWGVSVSGSLGRN